MQTACFRVDTPAVIYEQFDMELVAIHLDTGSYHSLVGAAADAFLLLAEEATAEELAEALQMKYEGKPEEIAATLGPFLSALEAEKLIARVEVRTTRGPLQLQLRVPNSVCTAQLSCVPRPAKPVPTRSGPRSWRPRLARAFVGDRANNG